MIFNISLLFVALIFSRIILQNIVHVLKWWENKCSCHLIKFCSCLNLINNCFDLCLMSSSYRGFRLDNLLYCTLESKMSRQLNSILDFGKESQKIFKGIWFSKLNETLIMYLYSFHSYAYLYLCYDLLIIKFMFLI